MTRPRAWESPLMKSDPSYYNCATCHYHRESCVGTHLCDRRSRRMRWDPQYFLCGDFAVADDPPKTWPKVARQKHLADYWVVE